MSGRSSRPLLAKMAAHVFKLGVESLLGIFADLGIYAIELMEKISAEIRERCATSASTASGPEEQRVTKMVFNSLDEIPDSSVGHAQDLGSLV